MWVRRQNFDVSLPPAVAVLSGKPRARSAAAVHSTSGPTEELAFASEDNSPTAFLIPTHELLC